MDTFSYYRARKILNMKLFDDENNKRWKKSVVDKQLEILCVSQFTLYNTWKVNLFIACFWHACMPLAVRWCN